VRRGATDCGDKLPNFASPERPEVMWSFSETIDGIAEACRAFETPVISGNVSFYNETEGRGIPPTPVIGMVGLLEDVRLHLQPGFKREGDHIALLGAPASDDDASVSEYAAIIEARTLDEMIANGNLSPLDLELERKVQAACLAMIEAGLLASAHDTSDGGLGVALAESCFTSPTADAHLTVGAEIFLDDDSHTPAHTMLFRESGSRIIVSFNEADRARVESLAAAAGCPIAIIGRTGGAKLTINIGDAEIVNVPVADLAHLWRTSLETKLALAVVA
jgi:phosphoribosylformylglycinamidine synthase